MKVRGSAHSSVSNTRPWRSTSTKRSLTASTLSPRSTRASRPRGSPHRRPSGSFSTSARVPSPVQRAASDPPSRSRPTPKTPHRRSPRPLNRGRPILVTTRLAGRSLCGLRRGVGETGQATEHARRLAGLRTRVRAAAEDALSVSRSACARVWGLVPCLSPRVGFGRATERAVRCLDAVQVDRRPPDAVIHRCADRPSDAARDAIHDGIRAEGRSRAVGLFGLRRVAAGRAGIDRRTKAPCVAIGVCGATAVRVAAARTGSKQRQRDSKAERKAQATSHASQLSRLRARRKRRVLRGNRHSRCAAPWRTLGAVRRRWCRPTWSAEFPAAFRDGGRRRRLAARERKCGRHLRRRRPDGTAEPLTARRRRVRRDVCFRSPLRNSEYVYYTVSLFAKRACEHSIRNHCALNDWVRIDKRDSDTVIDCRRIHEASEMDCDCFTIY